MKLVDLDTKITALLWDDEHEEETEREMTIGDFLDEFTVEGLIEIPLFFSGGRDQTNYDRIVSKTPEELAETYAGGCPNGDRLNCGKYYLHGGRDCFNCWLDWLKSPVEGDE